MGAVTELYSFSFGYYQDPQWMGFGPLRVLNETRISAGGDFPVHPHAHMEVISVVTQGQYLQVTSARHEATLQAGQFYVISAGPACVIASTTRLRARAIRACCKCG